jgi:3-phenylpropionate/trans-cinnamate dioxygenase ferredoxin subunit
MANQFVKAAQLSQIPPGKMKCVSVNGRRVLLANAGGTIFAADEMCTHEDASLCLGSLKGELLKCPLHGSRFDLRTGAVLDEPAEVPLRVYAVKVEGQDILVNLEA